MSSSLTISAPIATSAARKKAAGYNLCRGHESLRTTPAVQLGITDRVWSLGDLIDAALPLAPEGPRVTPPPRRRQFRVIEGGKAD